MGLALYRQKSTRIKLCPFGSVASTGPIFRALLVLYVHAHKPAGPLLQFFSMLRWSSIDPPGYLAMNTCAGESFYPHLCKRVDTVVFHSDWSHCVALRRAIELGYRGRYTPLLLCVISTDSSSFIGRVCMAVRKAIKIIFNDMPDLSTQGNVGP